MKRTMNRGTLSQQWGLGDAKRTFHFASSRVDADAFTTAGVVETKIRSRVCNVDVPAVVA